MCSCKSKNLSKSVGLERRHVSELAYMNERVKIDTTKTTYSEQLSENIRIIEELIITEYDKESGKPIKETKAKRETTQDSDKVVAEEEERGMSEVRNDSLNHVVDLHEMVESETDEESVGGQEAFGKWFGIILGLFVLIVYLWKKF